MIPRGNERDSQPLPALTRALVDLFPDGLVLFDSDDRLIYANQPGREALARIGAGGSDSPTPMAKLSPLSPRVADLGSDSGESLRAVMLGQGESATLAARERQAILKTLNETGWKLATTARQLGISRTTLWRRLRRYGIPSAVPRRMD